MNLMNAEVSLSDPSRRYNDTCFVENLEERNCFSYIDNDGNPCRMNVYDDGICLLRKCPDHLLELHLREEGYALITTEEGSCKINVKMVDMVANGDILVLHYLVEDDERIIKIKYC